METIKIYREIQRIQNKVQDIILFKDPSDNPKIENQNLRHKCIQVRNDLSEFKLKLSRDCNLEEILSNDLEEIKVFFDKIKNNKKLSEHFLNQKELIKK